jgi:hypothetical protein
MFSSNDQYDRKSTCCWFLFDINIGQSPCLMDGPSSEVNPYTPPNDHRILYASYNRPNKLNLHWRWFFGLPFFFDNSSFRFVLVLISLPTSYRYVHNRSILNKRKLLDTFYSTCWLVYVYHACFDDSHDWIRRQDQHSTLHSKPRIQLMEKLFINNL